MSDPKPAYWAGIPGEVRRDAVIPANAKLLYADISALCNERGYCFAGNEYLAGIYGWTERSVQRLIAALADRGYIRIEQIPGKERRIYAGAFLGPPGVAPSEGGDKNVTPDKKVVRGATKMSPPNNVDINSGNIPPQSPKGGGRVAALPKWKPERFTDFWDYYREHGRGENRKAAVKAWDKLRPDDDLIDQMARALQRQVKTEMWQRGVGIPYASTWLNNRRWEDDVPVNQGDKPGAGGGEEYMVGSDLPQW